MKRAARFRIGLAIAMSLSGVAMRATAGSHDDHYHRVRNPAADERDHRKKLREEQARKEREAEAQKAKAAAADAPASVANEPQR